ncbi:MAG TPA: EthD family reductase [Actinospica sp.]|nr:EthD family reductase [Actinospica sp.]
MTARFIVLWETPTDVEAFDRHYREVHIPLARELPGLRRYLISRDARPVRGETYFQIAELEWDTPEDLRAAFDSPAGRATAADVRILTGYAQVRSMIVTSGEDVR